MLGAEYMEDLNHRGFSLRALGLPIDLEKLIWRNTVRFLSYFSGSPPGFGDAPHTINELFGRKYVDANRRSTRRKILIFSLVRQCLMNTEDDDCKSPKSSHGTTRPTKEVYKRNTKALCSCYG